MIPRRRTVERRKLELAARIDVQRFRLRLLTRVRALGQPPPHADPGPAWRSPAVIVGILVAAAAAFLLREQAAATAGRLWRRWNGRAGNTTATHGTS